MSTKNDDLRLIEAGFPCHQVGAETQRERGASSALPPLYFLHVWWARRPLTPSRAAILASLLPADTDPDWFLRQLGIEKPVVEINGSQWVLTGRVLEKVSLDKGGEKVLTVDAQTLNLLAKEDGRRAKNRQTIRELVAADGSLASDPVLLRWQQESQPIHKPWPVEGDQVEVRMVAADPAHTSERIDFAKSLAVQEALGATLKLSPEDLYGYGRAFTNSPQPTTSAKVVLDPTSGGGSIPFEALRLGHKVIANELNPVASVILHATLEYPTLYGEKLIDDISAWGEKLIHRVADAMNDLTPFSPLPELEKQHLHEHCKHCPSVVPQFDVIEHDHTGLLYCRQVTCPHCGGQAPLLNTCWLSKEAGNKWGVRIIIDGRERGGSVLFETYRVTGSHGANGEDPGFATVNRGVGTCIHCRQAIEADEIKRQARGKSEFGAWQDRLYCVVAVRFQPKLDKKGLPQRFATGPRSGEIKTEKVRFFRPPNEMDLNALKKAEEQLRANWQRWDAAGLIPTEKFPQGNDMRPAIYGMSRWCDMFTPRQLLGHLTLVEGLNRLKPEIIKELGAEKGRAVITYLQFAIDKGLDYNSRQTRWEYTRGVVKGTFGRHDFSLKWTFGEMVFAGPYSGAAWGLSQIVDAYKGIAALGHREGFTPDIMMRNGTAAHLEGLGAQSADLICIDPPYYNNVQYAELSDYFYVWQRRTLADQYPDYFRRRLTNKEDEAVANPDRDGGAREAKEQYERLMGEIFSECRRVVKDSGIMTMMFTHKSQDAWETLTRSLIEHGWIITAAVPVESETQHGIHTKDTASAISSIYITCRKRLTDTTEPAAWTGFGGAGVAQRIRTAVTEGLAEFAALKLNPVDEMVSSYGRALRVLSEQWPVLDGDDEVGPIKAMNEASRVVASHQITRITGGRLQVEDLNPEAAMALTLFGIYGLAEFPYDEALNLSRSLNIALEGKAGGYEANGRFIGINTVTAAGRRTRARAEEQGFHAPLLRRGSKLRIAVPDERDERRTLDAPQTEWDLLQGMLISYKRGDLPVARAYLERHGGTRKELLIDLLHVWASEVPDENLRRQAKELHFGLS
jgi:putative DNA methylase